MNNIILNEFLQSGYFIGSPSENKIWCMSSSFKKYSSEKILAPPYFYLNNFYLSKSEPFCKGSSFFELSYSEFLTLLLNEESEKPNIKWEKISNEMYLSQFESLKIEIKENKLKKGVPYSFLKGNSHLTKMNKVYLLKSILESKRQNYSYIYGFWEQDKGFIGTSPELLFTQSGKDIHTIALAGTAPNQLETNKAQFQFDPKIQKEHY